ncbi:MAG: LysM peptidoglycan-binding domain-containing protein [Nanoarchaeota archaeon]
MADLGRLVRRTLLTTVTAAALTAAYIAPPREHFTENVPSGSDTTEAVPTLDYTHFYEPSNVPQTQYDPRLEKLIDKEIKKIMNPKRTELAELAEGLSRLTRFRDYIEVSSMVHNWPEKYFAAHLVVECQGRVDAVSPTKCKGPGQFDTATAEGEGITINFAVDERMMPDAFFAAGEYLAKAFPDRAGDPAMDRAYALGGYNSGFNGMRRRAEKAYAARLADAKEHPGKYEADELDINVMDFWDKIRGEGRAHIAKVLARQRIMEDPADYGLKFDMQPLFTETHVEYILGPKETFATLKREYDVSLAELIEANPHVRNPNRVPVNTKVYIPKTTETHVEYILGPKETFSTLKREYDFSLAELIEANPHVRHPDRVPVNTKVYIPRTSETLR